MPIKRFPELAISGHRYLRLNGANFGGITNRIRCLLTCSAFSKETPFAYWDGNWSGETMHEYSINDAQRVFSIPLLRLPTTSLNCSVEPIYTDWIILTPEIVNEKKGTAALCIDALSGDGLKSAEMLYQIPDRVYESLQAHFLGLFSSEYMIRIRRLTDICNSMQYATISFRFWNECVPAFKIASYQNRLDVNWETTADLFDMCKSVTDSKWLRLRPSVAALRSARNQLQKSGIENIIFMSDRWDGASFCTGSTNLIREAVFANFATGIERHIANMFVIANSSVLWRSKDSTYTHLPILLNSKWSMRIVDS